MFPNQNCYLYYYLFPNQDFLGSLDFLVHAIAYSDKNELTGRFINTTRDNFKNSLTISCYSLIDLARRAQPLMTNGGSIITLTYGGSNRVTPFYNVMGVAKAALESSVRYLANDLGPDGIRVNAVAPGYVMTDLVRDLIARGALNPSDIEDRTPMARFARPEEIAEAIAFLASPSASYITGVTLPVDGGWQAFGAPPARLGRVADKRESH